MNRNYLDFSVGIEINMSLVRGSEMTRVLCGRRNDLVLVFGSNLNWFQCRDRDWLGFGVEASKLAWLYRGDRIDLISVMASKRASCLCEGSNLTWFQCWNQKWPFSCARDWNWACEGRNKLVSIVINGLRFYVGGGRKSLGFRMRDVNGLVLVWASKLTWFLSGWSILT